MIIVLFPFCTLNWRVNNYVSRQRKGINRRNERTNIIRLNTFVAFGTVFIFLKTLTFCLDRNISLKIREDNHFVIKLGNQFSLHNPQNFSLRIMATLRNKRKLAAVSTETSENTGNSQSQNTSQSSEEI